MADRKFLVNLDLGLNKAKSFVFEDFSSDPTAATGRVYFNTTTGKLKYYNGSAWVNVGSGDGTGTVTSVALSLPSFITVSGSPVTTSGTLTGTLASQTANTIFAAPNGSAGTPTFRSLVAADIPSLTASKISDFTEAVQDITGGAVTAGTGISVSYDDAGAGTVTVTNTDLGSSQNIFKNFTDGTITAAADSNNDTFKFRGSNGATVTVGSDDATHGDNLLISLSSVPNSALANSSITVTAGSGLTGGGLVSLGGSVSLALGSHTHSTSDITGIQEYVEDTVGAMVSTNTESGIAVTYDDATGKLNFDVEDFTLTLAGDLTGSAIITNLGSATLTATIAPNSVALGTDTTGNYMSGVTAGTGISISHTPGEGSNATITNSGVTGISSASASEITVSAGTGNVVIGLPDDVAITNDLNVGGDLVVTGDLTVNGATTTLNTATLSVEDNIIILNNGVTGTPALNAGIEVQRGTSTNASITWNETTDTWTAGLTGSEVAIARKFVASGITTVGGTGYTVSHNLGTSDVTVQTFQGGTQVECQVAITDANTVTITTNSNETNLKVVVVG